MSKRAFLVGTHQTAVARDIRGQNGFAPSLYVLAAQRRTPKLVEIEWYISELWADVRLCPSPKRVKSGKAQCEHMFSALPPTTDIHQARTPCLKSAGAMNGWSATTK